jgi:hypothetical protein
VQFRIAKNAVAVQLRNFSRYFLGVYFGSNPPSGSTATALAGGFHTVIAPGEQPVLSVVGNYTSDPSLFPNGLTEFTGDVFLQPISVDANLALTGGMSQNYATLTAYQSGEVLPASTAAPRIVDASSQQRVVAVPLGAQTLTGRATPAPGPGSSIVLRTDGLSAFNISLGVAYVYLFHCQVRTTPQATGICFYDYSLVADIMNGPTIVTSFPLHGMALESWVSSTSNNYDMDVFFPSCPTFAPFLFAANTATSVRYRLLTNSIQGVAQQLYWDIGVGVDLVNFVAPGTVGNFTPNTGIF